MTLKKAKQAAYVPLPVSSTLSTNPPEGSPTFHSQFYSILAPFASVLTSPTLITLAVNVYLYYDSLRVDGADLLSLKGGDRI